MFGYGAIHKRHPQSGGKASDFSKLMSSHGQEKLRPAAYS